MNRRNTLFEKRTHTGILLAVIFLAAASFMVYAKDLKIVYNFQNGRLTSDDGEEGKTFAVKRGASIIFQIVNINRFAYKVLINGELMTGNDKYAAPARPVKFLSSTEKTETPGTPTGETPAAEDTQPSSDPVEQLNHELEQVGIIKEFQAALSDIQDKESTFLEFDTKKTRLCNSFMKYDPPKSQVDPFVVVEKCTKMVKQASVTLENIRRNFVENNSGTVSAEAFLDKYSQLRNLLDEFSKYDYISGIETILNNVKPENFTVTLTLPSVDADIVEFTVKIEPTDPRNVASINQLNGPIVVQVKGGWVIDYSTGVFFKVNSNDLEYWFEEGVVDKTKVILRARKKTTVLSEVGQLMHIYLQRTANVKWCPITFGLGTGAADKLSYYLGTGLILGAKNRFVVNVGITAVKVDKLLPKFSKIAADGNEIDRPNNDVPIVESIYKIGYFVSLTYNLLGGNK